MAIKDQGDAALLALLSKLGERGYRFTTITPASHGRVLAQPDRAEARTLRDVLGWSLPFAAGVLPVTLADDLRAAGMIDTDGALHRCRIRVSSVGPSLHIHSAFPTDAADAVFLGPDSYRFADAIVQALAAEPLGERARILDIGTGAGVGAVTAGRLCSGAQVVATDINPQALRFAAINAAAAGVQIETMISDGVAAVSGAFDLILINPPYIVDSGGPAYRDGGAMHGAALPLRLALDSLPRLSPGGRLLLYTGSAIIAGEDGLHDALKRAAKNAGYAIIYREIDPDVFGEELSQPAYAGVERIALVSVLLRRPR